MAKEYFVKEGDVDVLRGDVDKKISSPNTAEVGQILSVKAIDENGKPTEWEVVNKPGSGPGESSPYIYMTQAEYEALTEYEQDKMYWVTYPFTGCYLVWKNGIAIMGEGCVELPSYRYGSNSPSERTEQYFCTNRNLIINFNIYGQSGFANAGGSNLVKIANRVELVEMTDNVTYIHNYCFSGCVTLEKIKLSNNMPELRGGTFKGCTKLKSVIIGSGTLTINSRVFEECSALESITFPDSVTGIKAEAFLRNIKLKTVIIGNGIETMASNTFVNCNALELIVINKPQDSVSGAPWGATNATVVWKG